MNTRRDDEHRRRRDSDVQNGLYRLDELDDYEVADDDPDVRGWDVLGHDRKKFGEVDELIVDTSSMKVRYLDIKLNDDVYNDDEERHILIPVGTVDLDNDNNKVLVENVDFRSVTQYPIYHGGPISRDHEREIRTAHRYEEPYNENDDFYSHRSFDESRFYRNRRDNSGGSNNPGFDQR